MLNKICAVLGGSGGAAFHERPVAELVVQMALRNRNPQAEDPRPIRVGYVGTATYDQEEARVKQTVRFSELGCEVVPLDVAWPPAPKINELRTRTLGCDVILVSGGNSLYAIRRWQQLGFDKILREAAEQQAVMCGGSFGALFVFDGGHSDSADPATFRPKSKTAGGNAEAADAEQKDDGAPPADWKYLRVGALGFLPGLCCPHHDRMQSNGVWRYDDFNGMMLRHEGETGVCIDHWCCLVLDGEGNYSVFPVPGKEGSVVLLPQEQEVDSSASSSPFIAGAKHDPPNGKPGVWIKRVVDKTVRAMCVKPAGRIEALLATKGTIVPATEEEEKLMLLNPLPTD